MFDSRIRIIAITIFTIMTISFFIIGRDKLAILSLICCLLQIYSYFRYGTVWLAFKQFKKQNYPKIIRLLGSIKKPEYLSKSQKGFYYMLKGAVNLYHEKNYQLAEENIKKAIEIGVRTTNNISINYIMLSQSGFQQGKYDNAMNYLKEAVKTPHSSMLDEGLQNLKNEIEEAMKPLTIGRINS